MAAKHETRQWVPSGRVAGALCAALAAVLALADRPARADSEFSVGGLVDVVGHGNGETLYLNYTNQGDSNFDHLRARVFLQGGSDRTRAFLQLLLADVGYSKLRFYGGYVLHQPFESHEMYFEVGKIPVHGGTWAPRTYSDENPLIGIPLAYYYKSSLPSQQMPVDLNQLLAHRGQGQVGINYKDPSGAPRGTPWVTMPIYYDNCWDYGAFVLGSGTRYDYAVGTSFGAPGAPVNGPDTNRSVALHAKVGFAPVTGLQLHVTVSRGAYLADVVAPYLPAGASVTDYAQTVWVGSLEYGWRHLTVNAEAFWNDYETPLYRSGLSSRSHYLEADYKFLPGWYAAGRYDVLRFSDVETSSGKVTWDDSMERFELGVGYHPTRELLVKAVGQLTDDGDGWDIDRMLPAVQISFRY